MLNPNAPSPRLPADCTATRCVPPDRIRFSTRRNVREPATSTRSSLAAELTGDDPEPAVKNFKDKIKKRIQRASTGAP